MHPNSRSVVKWKGFEFDTISHALVFSRISPTYSLKPNALKSLYKKIDKTDVTDLHKFDSLPTANDWYDRVKEILWKLYMQKFSQAEYRRKLREIRGVDFVFTDGYGGRRPDPYISGYVSKSGKVSGGNLIGNCLVAVRSKLQSKLIVQVCGGRDYDDAQMVFRVLDFINATWNIHQVVHGNAKGADTFAKNWAKLHHKGAKSFPADWDNLDVPKCRIKTNSQGKQYNALAGLNRNEEMAKYMVTATRGNKGTDQVLTLGFTGGTGTQHMLTTALDNGIPTLMQIGSKMERLLEFDENESPVTEKYTPSKYMKVSGLSWF